MLFQPGEGHSPHGALCPYAAAAGGAHLLFLEYTPLISHASTHRPTSVKALPPTELQKLSGIFCLSLPPPQPQRSA